MSFDGLNHDRKTSMPAIAVSIEVITTVLLGLRIGSRFSTSQAYLGLDDILISAAWLTGLGLTVAVLLGTEKYGLNRHVWDVPPEHFAYGGLMGFIVEILFFWSTCFAKVSVLMFYRRLVEGTLSQKFRYAIWAAIAFVIGYTISFFVVILVACAPVRAIWLQFDLTWRATNEFRCKSRDGQVAIAKLIGSLSVVTDFYSVLLPAALVMQIQISRKQKIGLFFIFGLGMLVVGAGIARTYYLGRVFEETIDKTWWTWDVFLASIIECNVAIICACAPSVKALFGKHFKNATSRYGGSYASRSYGKGSYGTGSSASEAGYGRQVAPPTPATELKPQPPVPKKDSLYPFKMVRSVLSHEYLASYQEDVPVAYSATTSAPTARRATQSPRSDLFDTQFPRPPNLTQEESQKTFFVTPTPSASSDDEINLVSDPYLCNEGRATHKPIIPQRTIQVTDDGERRMSIRSMSPASGNMPHPDPLMPQSTIPRERLERTRFPII